MGANKSPSQVDCTGRAASLTSCASILEYMSATTEMEVFGSGSNVSATVSLPLELQSSKQLEQVPTPFEYPFLIQRDR